MSLITTRTLFCFHNHHAMCVCQHAECGLAQLVLAYNSYRGSFRSSAPGRRIRHVGGCYQDVAMLNSLCLSLYPSDSRFLARLYSTLKIPPVSFLCGYVTCTPHMHWRVGEQAWSIRCPIEQHRVDPTTVCSIIWCHGFRLRVTTEDGGSGRLGASGHQFSSREVCT